jgi:two-component system sensor histidine kinase BaeS
VHVRVGPVAQRPTLVVADTGIGIAAEDLPHVFDRFYRADAARSRVEPSDAATSGESSDGTGLGLAIARWIATAHDAEVALTSRDGDGTTATVVFPPAREPSSP